jgi:predicted phage tail component-like protein
VNVLNDARNHVNALDFYFNGHWLSEFEGVVISSVGGNGIRDMNALVPLKENKVEQVLGKEAWLVTNVLYNPRSFVVPVFFQKLSDNIREIAAWLNILEPTDFYFENDEQKLLCLVDGQIDIGNLGYIGADIGGVTEIKFIAYDPFYYAIKDVKWIFTTGAYVKAEEDKKYGLKLNTVSNFSNLILKNNGNYKSYPLIKITGSGDITLTINGNSYTFTGVSDLFI